MRKWKFTSKLLMLLVAFETLMSTIIPQNVHRHSAATEQDLFPVGIHILLWGERDGLELNVQPLLVRGSVAVFLF